jgi:type I restriction enzyme S subunit
MENCFYQKAIHRLRGKHEGINPRFMLWYMHFAQANGQFSDFTSQSSIAHLTQEKLAKVPVLLPSAEEQDLIVSRIDAHESVMQGQRDFRVNLNAQKLGLMQDLLTGKVAVTVESQHNAPTHAE